ncbi:MAG: hypothetical protein V3S04_00905 [Candidatus Omnitrophota bacterium]
MLGAGYSAIFFTIFGISLIFVIAWILKSEKTKNDFKDETERLKRQLECDEREKFVLFERLEDSEDTVRELEELAESQPPHSERDEVARELVDKMAGRLEDLEGENDGLKAELNEARDSLEEVYRAVHEEEPVS